MPWYRPDNCEKRFWDRVRISSKDECWLWTGYQNKQGYGRFRGRRLNGDTAPKMLVHRFSYEIHIGPIPKGLVIDHLCRTPGCVNPNHLEIVTPQENCARGLINQFVPRTHCMKGHKYTIENTWYGHQGRRRYCKICSRRKLREWRSRRKQKREIEDENKPSVPE